MDVFKTLIVDDNPGFRRTLADILCARFPDMCIVQAGEGNEALRIVDKLLPDLIFMDIRMPGASGLELTKKIKRDHPKTMILILTSYDLSEYRAAAQRCGANDFVCKGVTSTEEILNLVELLITHGDIVNRKRD